MNKRILMALVALPLATWAQDYHLTVKLNGVKAPAEAYLVYEFGWSDQRVLDSVAMEGGVCTFKGTADDAPVKAMLVVNHSGRGLAYGAGADQRIVYLEKGNILLQGGDSVKNAALTGAPLNAVYHEYSKTVLDPLENVNTAINAEYRAASADRKKDKAFKDSLGARSKVAQLERDSLKYVYIRQNPGSYFSLVALKELAGGNVNNIDVPKIEPLFKSLSDSLRGSKPGLDFAATIERARGSIGTIAPDFTEDDVNGHPVKLSDFRGKYVLLDFWASWCGPCRAENPNVLRAYNAYKDKNFTVLGVSLDRPGKKDDWLAAINKDGLPWTQVSDLKFWNNAAAKLYSITSIPQNFLIDPKGKIVGWNLHGDELEKKLQELL
jgi:peroxiredoxin